ncbi:CRP-like cAMP-binding protein [Pontibacter ummariensis]|uniref:cAMP-binding domain of CRP or a regulatory subunit of cAMP-dependent protein kinases n=1 Tax=Pontibacter ummariensis TaxID=1610492 RepID=A0A239JXU5_9BACT|nr:response regulator [Pontibacter ummariensis]PRY07269.1 CRP-like cAMP-binding protein [Pontibacter ummariensis]SNT10807.1 cAMP-binding domain of CRP or a regulatory subunit of cAMP-dependent protein kinases [Pontibacter ummariensis]
MKTVLLIEDNELIRENTAEILELANFRVVKAENGKQGVVLALQQKPDIVVCDIMMPNMDGYGVLHVFHKNPVLEAIPFIFLSARTERADIRKGMESGADDYITKPFQESELLNAIEGRLRKVELLKKTPVLSSASAGLTQELMPKSPTHQELEHLAHDKKIYLYKKKQTLYTEGNEPTKIFFLKKGKVKVYSTNQEGKEYITGIINESEFFGYLPFIEETEYQETAETMEDSEVVLIPKEEFLTLLYHDQLVANRLIRTLATSITEKEKMLSSLAFNSLRKRTAESLLFLLGRYQTSANQHPPIPVSRHDIAGLVGASPEAVSRTLSEFKNEQLIDIVGSKILILNKQKLLYLRG